jgi:hypothetical protein
VLGPEEWGWLALKYSGFDQQWGDRTHWLLTPDRLRHGNRDFIPWFLAQVADHDRRVGRRTLDVLTVHYYPTSGEFGGDVSPAVQGLRNRSTRSLWDATYVDESWIHESVELIPRLRGWVEQYYPGTRIGITEYNWGAEMDMNGATAQAELLGLFGRERLDVANYWATPRKGSPVHLAFQMYRNFDGKHSEFGDVSVAADTPRRDELSVFAAQRTSDRALTIMLVNKIGARAAVRVCLANFPAVRAEVWQLAQNTLAQRPELAIGETGLSLAVPAQSVTLLVLPSAGSGGAAAVSSAC